MSQPILSQAARRTPPGVALTATVGTASTTAISLTSFVDEYVMFQAKGDSIYLAFGTAAVGAATANCIFLKDGEREEFYIDAAHQYVRAKSDSASNKLIYASVGA